MIIIFPNIQLQNRLNLLNKQYNKHWFKKLEENNIFLNNDMEVSHFLNPYNQTPFLSDYKFVNLQPSQQESQLIREPFFTPRKITFEEDHEKIQKDLQKNIISKGFTPLIRKKSDVNEVYIEEDILEDTKKEPIKNDSFDQDLIKNHEQFINQKNQIFSQDLQNLGKESNIDKKNHLEDIDSDVGDLFEETTSKPPQILKNQLDGLNFQQNTKKEKQMDEKIQNALKQENQQLKTEQKQEDQEEEEEELNSNDDVSDYEGEVKTDDRLLLAYYEKSTRKKDKRKIILKDCVLRLNGTDFIFPTAKGDFTWVAARDNF